VLFSLDRSGILISINQIMSNALARAFERVTGWREYSEFEHDHEGYITREKVGEFGAAFFLWRVDREPVHLDHMFMDGKTFIRFTDNQYL